MDNGRALSAIVKMNCYRDRLAFERGELLWTVKNRNIVPDLGLDNALAIFATPYTPIADWYIGLVDNAGFSSYQYSDSAAQIGGSNGWAEWASYTEANRQLFVGVPVPSNSGFGQVDNSASQAIFTMSAGGSLRGAFMVSSNVKGGTSGILTSEVNFDSGTTAVIIGNIIQVTYNMQGFS